MATATAVDTDEGQGSTLVTSTLVVMKRAVLRYLRTPQVIVIGTAQGVLFMLIFQYVFGGAIGLGGSTHGLSYVNFLIPGFITTGLLFTGMTGTVAVAEDFAQGFIDRLRLLRRPRTAVRSGRVLADTSFCTWSAAIMVLVGFAVGFRLHGTALQGIEAFLLLIVFAFAFEWLFLWLGMISGNPQAAQGMGLLVVPWVFISSAFVPVESMPGWLQAIAKYQPVTFMVNAVRTLTQGRAAEIVLGH